MIGYTILLAGTISLLVLVYTLPKFIIRKISKHYSSINFFLSDQLTNTICLTFDDAPYGKSFDDTIDILSQYDIKATFFVIAGFVNETNRSSLINAIKSGHQLANHGSIDRMHAKLPYNELKDEITKCQELLKELYKEAGKSEPSKIYYRPGSGFISNTILQLQKDLDMKVVLGSVYPYDPHIPLSNVNYNYLLQKIEPSDIIILHDRKWTLNLLTKILPKLNEYECRTLDSC